MILEKDIFNTFILISDSISILKKIIEIQDTEKIINIKRFLISEIATNLIIEINKRKFERIVSKKS